MRVAIIFGLEKTSVPRYGEARGLTFATCVRYLNATWAFPPLSLNEMYP